MEAKELLRLERYQCAELLIRNSLQAAKCGQYCDFMDDLENKYLAQKIDCDLSMVWVMAKHIVYCMNPEEIVWHSKSPVNDER